MSTNYHDAIATGAAANAATFEAPLAQIDQALTDALITAKDGHIIQEEGSDLAQQQRLNFVGMGVTATNSAGVTIVTIPIGSLHDGFATNYQITTAIATNNLTVALKGLNGSDPSATNPIFFRSGNTLLTLTAALSVTITAAMADIFLWDAGKVQGNDAQLFVYLINNNGTPQLGVSPFSELTTVATNFRDAVGQTGAAGWKNIVMSGTRNATNSCRVIGRVNVSQSDANNWQAPVTAKVVNKEIHETDWLIWTPAYSAAAPMTLTGWTTSTAIYKTVSDIMDFFVNATGTTATTASTSIYVMTPVLSSVANINLPSNVVDGGLNIVGGGLISASVGVVIKKIDSTNWGLGAGRVIQANGQFPIY